METVHFQNERNFREKAARLFEAQKRRIFDVLPQADIQHIGSTAIPGSLTKGDLDIQVRVSAEMFPMADEILEGIYERNEGSTRGPSFAAFKDDELEPPLGVQLCVIGSEHDFFWKVRDFLLVHEDYKKAYDDLKGSFEGKDMDEYRAAKGAFFSRVMQTSAFRAL